MKACLNIRENEQIRNKQYVRNDEKNGKVIWIFCKALTKKILSDIINMKMLGSCTYLQLHVH